MRVTLKKDNFLANTKNKQRFNNKQLPNLSCSRRHPCFDCQDSRRICQRKEHFLVGDDTNLLLHPFRKLRPILQAKLQGTRVWNMKVKEQLRWMVPVFRTGEVRWRPRTSRARFVREIKAKQIWRHKNYYIQGNFFPVCPRLDQNESCPLGVCC